MTFDRWAIIEGHYWFYAHYHRGQFSWEYQRLCKISKYYKPSILHSNPSTEESQEVYDALVEQHVNFHDGKKLGSKRTK